MRGECEHGALRRSCDRCEMAAELTRLRAEVEALRKDAEQWKSIARVQSAKLSVALDQPGASARLQQVMQSPHWRSAAIDAAKGGAA